MASTALTLPGPTWGRVPISRIEDLHDGVLGANFDAVQFSREPISGSLAFAQLHNVTYTTASIEGGVGLYGPLSETRVTLGVLLDAGERSHHWQSEVYSLSVGVFRAGDVHEAHYQSGAFYGAATLSEEHLEEIAADEGLVLDFEQLGGTGVSDRPMDRGRADALRRGLRSVHDNRPAGSDLGQALAQELLGSMIAHLAREPRLAVGVSSVRNHGQVVRRACRFIEENLEEPLTIDAIAKAAYTSRRTLYRAFVDIMGESPQTYVRTLRLNRIRQDLATDAEARCTVTVIANRWGMSELGRMSGMYREMFGELPSETLIRSREGAAEFAAA